MCAHFWNALFLQVVIDSVRINEPVAVFVHGKNPGEAHIKAKSSSGVITKYEAVLIIFACLEAYELVD